LDLRFLYRAEQVKAKRQEGGAPPVGQEAEVSDAHETLRKQVQQKSPQEFIHREGHQPVLVLMSGITPAKGDFVFSKRHQAMVGDGHAMGVAAQILEHILGATEGWTCKSPRTPWIHCRMVIAFVSMMDSITSFPSPFITAIEIASL
jgi:hypothetical protein